MLTHLEELILHIDAACKHLHALLALVQFGIVKRVQFVLLNYLFLYVLDGFSSVFKGGLELHDPFVVHLIQYLLSGVFQ